jgi:hypothetical protein
MPHRLEAKDPAYLAPTGTSAMPLVETLRTLEMRLGKSKAAAKNGMVTSHGVVQIEQALSREALWLFTMP